MISQSQRSRAEQSKAQQCEAERSEAEQSRAMQCAAKQSAAKQRELEETLHQKSLAQFRKTTMSKADDSAGKSPSDKKRRRNKKRLGKHAVLTVSYTCEACGDTSKETFNVCAKPHPDNPEEKPSMDVIRQAVDNMIATESIWLTCPKCGAKSPLTIKPQTTKPQIAGKPIPMPIHPAPERN